MSTSELVQQLKTNREDSEQWPAFSDVFCRTSSGRQQETIWVAFYFVGWKLGDQHHVDEWKQLVCEEDTFLLMPSKIFLAPTSQRRPELVEMKRSDLHQ